MFKKFLLFTPFFLSLSLFSVGAFANNNNNRCEDEFENLQDYSLENVKRILDLGVQKARDENRENKVV